MEPDVEGTQGMADVDERLSEALLREGMVGEEKLKAASEHAQREGTSLALALVEMGLADGNQIIRALSKLYRLPAVDLDKIRVEEKVYTLIEGDLARRRRVLPLRKLAGTLTLAVANPWDEEALEEVRERTGLALEVVLVDEHCLMKHLRRYYDPSPPGVTEAPPMEREWATYRPNLAQGALSLDPGLTKLLRGEGGEGREELLAGGMMKQVARRSNPDTPRTSIQPYFISAEFHLLSMSGELEFRVNGDWPGGHLPPLRDPVARAADYGRGPPPEELASSYPDWVYPWGSFIRLRSPTGVAEFSMRDEEGTDRTKESRDTGLQIAFRERSDVYLRCSRPGIDPPERREGLEEQGDGPFDELGRGRESVNGPLEGLTVITFEPLARKIDPVLWHQQLENFKGEIPQAWLTPPSVSVYFQARLGETWSGYVWYVAPRLREVIPNPSAGE